MIVMIICYGFRIAPEVNLGFGCLGLFYRNSYLIVWL